MWPSVSRAQVESLIGIIMRTPGLFIIDYWWQHERNRAFPKSMSKQDILNALIINLALLHGVFLLLLPLPSIRLLYTHFISGALFLCSHFLSHSYVNMEEDNYFTKTMESVSETTIFKKHAPWLVVQILIAVLISFLLHGPRKPLLPQLACYTLPVIARLAEFPPGSLVVFHNISSAVAAISVLQYIWYHLPSLLDSLKEVYWDVILFTEARGWMAVAVSFVSKLFVPAHFLLFWVLQVIVELYGGTFSSKETSPWGNTWYILLLKAVSSICVSPVSLVATAVTITYLAYVILCAVKFYLLGRAAFQHYNPLHNGWTEGLTMLLLSLHTGLMEMKLPSKMVVLTIILFIILSSLLQSALEIAEPAVLSASASRSQNKIHQMKALLLCLFLFVFPLHLAYHLAKAFPVDFWMVVVLSSSILTSAQVVDLVVVHCLFSYDSSRREPWDALDEVVYYVRGVTKVVEFLVAVSVVAVGFWESVTGRWNLTNSIILIAHCYFNVWQRMQAGCRSLMLRREAMKKMELLPNATQEQLAKYNDVCAICYADMGKACVTKCAHYFHRSCLRKWLYYQDRCPLCHATISDPTPHQDQPQAQPQEEPNQVQDNLAEDVELIPGDNQNDEQLVFTAQATSAINTSEEEEDRT